MAEEAKAKVTAITAEALAEIEKAGGWPGDIISILAEVKKGLLEMQKGTDFLGKVKLTNPASVFTENESYRLNNRGRAIKVEEVYPNGWIRATYVQGGPSGEIYLNARTIDQFETF